MLMYLVRQQNLNLQNYNLKTLVDLVRMILSFDFIASKSKSDTTNLLLAILS